MLKTARRSALKKCSGFCILQYILCILAYNIRITFFFIWSDFCFETSGYRVVLHTENNQKGALWKNAPAAVYCSIFGVCLSLRFFLFNDEWIFLQKVRLRYTPNILEYTAAGAFFQRAPLLAVFSRQNYPISWGIKAKITPYEEKYNSYIVRQYTQNILQYTETRAFFKSTPSSCF